jgi:hypothetical protein
MPRYEEYLAAIDEQRPTLVPHRERGEELTNVVFRLARGRTCHVRAVAAFDLLAALSSFTDDYALEPPRGLFAVDIAVSILARIRDEHCLCLPEQLDIALGCADGRPFEALLGLHTATRVLARGRDTRLHPSFQMSLDERLRRGEAIAPFHPDDALGGDPLGDTYHFWANVVGGVYAACPTNPRASRALVGGMLYAGPWLMHSVRETLFGSTLFCGTHARIDRLGLGLGRRFGRRVRAPVSRVPRPYTPGVLGLGWSSSVWRPVLADRSITRSSPPAGDPTSWLEASPSRSTPLRT